MPLTQRVHVVQASALAFAGIMLSISACHVARLTDHDRVRGVLEIRAEWRARDIERKLAVAGRRAEALAIYLAADGEVTAAQFHRFAQLAHDQADVDSALYWAPWVDGASRTSFVAAARHDVDPGYDIRDVGPDDYFTSAATRAAYVPELYEEAFDNAPGVSGTDLILQPDRKALVERVRDIGRPAVSTPFLLLMGGVRVPGFIILWPVYKTGAVPPSVEGRRAAFRGIAAVRLRLDRILSALIADTPDLIGAIDISTGSDVTTARPIATYDPAERRVTIIDQPALDVPGSLTVERNFTVLGQYWKLRLHFSPARISDLVSIAPWAWLALGLSVTAILVVLVLLQSARLGKAEVIASETDDRFRRLFDENPIGMVLATADDYRVVRVNAAFCRTLEYTQAELVGHSLDEISPRDAVDMPALPPGTNAGWQTVDKHYVCKSGRIVNARVRVVPLAPSSSGEAIVLGMAEDVTEQRKLEDTLRQAQKLEAVGQLTGGIAHDFNNLLGIIIGNLDLLQATLPNNAEAGELVGEAIAAAWRGADLTQRLLAFARRQPLHPQRLALNEQIAEIAKLLTRTIGDRVHISLDLAHDVWPVLADATQLEACIINLATNARDAMPNGGLLIIATANRQLDDSFAIAHPDVKAGDYAMIEITDTGSGMSPGILAQIFEPFFTTKDPGKGTGLGLSMVFGFLKQSNGHVSAYSEPGEGSTFRLYLPRADGDATENPPSATSAIRRGQGETVLVVEDNEALRRVVARQLRDLGYAVIEANSAASALAVINRQPVALVFSDVFMPGDLDGFGLATNVMARFPSTKVLLTSGFPESKISGKLGGPSASARVLGKPYRTDDLARVVREVLEA